jgi:hypothetical protein
VSKNRYPHESGEVHAWLPLDNPFPQPSFQVLLALYLKIEPNYDTNYHCEECYTKENVGKQGRVPNVLRLGYFVTPQESPTIWSEGNGIVNRLIQAILGNPDFEIGKKNLGF